MLENNRILNYSLWHVLQTRTGRTRYITLGWTEPKKKAFPFFDLSSMQIKHFKDNCKMHLYEVNLKQPQNTTPAKTNKNAKAETM